MVDRATEGMSRGRCGWFAVMALLAFGSSLMAGANQEDRAAGVVFRVAAPPVGTVPSRIADRLRSPDKKLWIIYHADWASGRDVLDLHVTREVHLRMTVKESVARRAREEAPGYLAVYVDGRLFAVGSLAPGEAANEIVLKDLRPERAAQLAKIFGVPGAMAAGPRLIVAPRSSSMRPGGRMTVDVYVSGIPDIVAYHVVLEVRNALRGVFLIEGARINRTRSDYIFAGLDDAQSSAKLTAALITGSAPTATVDPTRSSYLGTLVFRATPKAEGTFTVWIQEESSELHDADGRSLPFRAGAASIVVGEHLAPRWRR